MKQTNTKQYQPTTNAKRWREIDIYYVTPQRSVDNICSCHWVKLQMVTPGKASLSFLARVTFVCVGYCRKSWIVIYICVAATINALINIKAKELVFSRSLLRLLDPVHERRCVHKNLSLHSCEKGISFPLQPWRKTSTRLTIFSSLN